MKEGLQGVVGEWRYKSESDLGLMMTIDRNREEQR